MHGIPQRAELQNINTKEPSQIQAEQGKSPVDEPACMIANMLSGMTQESEAIRHKAESTPKGMFLGNGLPQYQRNLLKKFVDGNT